MIYRTSHLNYYLCFDYALDENIGQSSRFEVNAIKYNDQIMDIEKRTFRQLSVKTNTIYRTLFKISLNVDKILFDHEIITFNISQKYLSRQSKQTQSYIVQISQVFTNMMDEDISIHRIAAFEQFNHQEIYPIVITTRRQKVGEQDIMEYLNKKQFHILQKENSLKQSMSALESKCEILSTVSSEKKFHRRQRDRSLQKKIRSSKRERLNISMFDKQMSVADTQLSEEYRLPHRSLRRSILKAHAFYQDKPEDAYKIEQIKNSVLKLGYPFLILFLIGILTYLMFPARRI